MPKGEDEIIRNKNKSIRKKLRSDSAKVSNRIAAIIAQKKRRQSGNRRTCQGMCFSLPTLEDPFNDKYMNLDSKVNKKRVEKELIPPDEKSTKKISGNISMGEGCPSKFLISCLKTVQDTMRDNEACNRERPLFFDSWGFEFWRCYTSGRHVLETSGCATMEQIAWVGSTAVDTITIKEKDGESFTGPYLLFIVPSQEKATQVRAVYKALKLFGIHTVSLHPGASIDHQIHGLKTCEPEFLVCTPDRLLELVSMEAVDISGVCSLIIDGLEFSSGDAYIDSIKSVQHHISVDPHTVVFCSGLTDAYLPAVSSLLPTPMCRLSQDKITFSKSAT
ncbi:hypothetical protein QVD17_23376 [Tagetes erecta]|uniref:DEAD/DEAH-box helicase domain-containing protein n=1 Tax=Tagetes erecta TaxID=13708 RepID=A0AAD8KH16_TARER|nr:hypothetical protein QVD17_23376 [Tagetes erecta]